VLGKTISTTGNETVTFTAGEYVAQGRRLLNDANKESLEKEFLMLWL
jgi:hypothetical protein